MALAHSAPLLPHLPPNLPAPTREQFFRGIWAGRTLPGGASRLREHPPLPSGTVQHRTGRKPGHGPLCPGHVGHALTQPPYRTTLETLHKHSDTRLKIMARHPRTYKTSKGLILPREIYYTLTSIKGLEKEVGVIKKEKSKLKTHTRHRTRKHTDTTGLVGKRGNIQGKRTNNTIRYPC